MKKIRVFGVLNHLANNYEMLKLAENYPVKFSYIENNVRRWSRYSHRPRPETWLSPEQFDWVTYYEPGKYDVAILHVDQQHVDPNIGKGQLYRALNEVIQDIPKIVINHGTPMNDQWDDDFTINGGTVQTHRGEKKLNGMKELIDNNFMVVNSYEAVNRWGWGYPLIHGMDANDWLDLPKEPRVLISLSPGGLDKYYNRQLLSAIKAEVKEMSGFDVIHTNVNVGIADMEDFKELMGTALIGIYPFKDSPMPRSRTEAMLSGQCILTSRHHNADEFIEHGVNGFILPDNPQSYAKAIHYLINECYQDAVEIGQRGKQTAQELFKKDRYQEDLWYLIKEVSKGRKPEWTKDKIW